METPTATRTPRMRQHSDMRQAKASETERSACCFSFAGGLCIRGRGGVAGSLRRPVPRAGRGFAKYFEFYAALFGGGKGRFAPVLSL